MSLTELLPALRELSRADKLRVMQFLVLELAAEEGAVLTPEVSYPIWSPYEAFDAAAVLLDLLKSTEQSKHA